MKNQLNIKDEKKGSVAIMFALAAMSLTMLLGASIDLSLAASKRRSVDNAADAALLSTIRQAQIAIDNNDSDWESKSKTYGVQFFNANITNIKNVTINSPTITLTNNSGVISGTLSYTGTSPTVIMSIANINSLSLNNTIKATYASAGTSKYIDIYFLVDVSPSMGIGATTTDQTTMVNATIAAGKVGCVFACHYNDTNNGAPTILPDNYAPIRSSGAKLRVDVAKDAVKQSIQMIAGSSSAPYTRIAIYTFSNSIMSVFPLSSNLTAAANAANSIDLTSNINQGGTNIGYSLQGLNAILPTPGSGSSASNPLGTVILITDGIQNSLIEKIGSSPPYTTMFKDTNWADYAPNHSRSINGWVNTDEVLQGLNPTSCSPIKTKGYGMMVLNVEYIIPPISQWISPTDTRFPFIRDTLMPLFDTTHAQCASSGSGYISATTPQEIIDGAKVLTAGAGSTSEKKLRLTQ